MMSTVPSRSASIIASRSSSARSGGASRKKVRYSPTSLSLSDRLLIDTPAVTRAPSALARAIAATRRGRRDLGRVVGAAGQPRQRQVALERDGFGLARNAGKPEPAGIEPFIHDAAGGEVAVLGLMRDDGAEVARIGQRAAHDQRAGDGVAAFGERDRAGFPEQPELGHLAAFEPLGDRRRRVDVDHRRVARRAQDEFDQRDIVDRPDRCRAS